LDYDRGFPFLKTNNAMRLVVIYGPQRVNTINPNEVKIHMMQKMQGTKNTHNVVFQTGIYSLHLKK